LTPTEDKGAFLAIGSAPSNVNVDYVQAAMAPYQKMLTDTDEVQFAMSISGVPSTNQSLNVVTLKDWKDRSRSQAQVLAELNAKAKGIPEVSVSGFAFPEIETGEQGPPIGFVISTSQGYADLANVAGKFLEAMQKSGKFVYSSLDLKFDTAQMHIKIDREKAGTYGITMKQISATLGSFLSAATVERVDIDGRAYKIISQVKRDNRLSPQSWNNYYVSAANGESVPLSSLISVSLEPQPSSLPRFSQLNSAVISAVPMPGSSIGDAIQWLEDSSKELLPQGYNYDFKGEARQLVQEGNALAVTFVLAVIIIFLVLAIQFESIRDPMVIMISVPLAISGALLALNTPGAIQGLLGMLGHVTGISYFNELSGKISGEGSTLNIYSQVGLITLVGLITKHGILMCEVAKEEQLNHGRSRIDAIRHAAKVRLRPILMTTAAMIAGLVPLLYATGAGAVSRFSMGIVIVSGLAVGTLFTLFVLPVIYSYVASEHKPLPEFDENIKPIEGEINH